MSVDNVKREDRCEMLFESREIAKMHCRNVCKHSTASNWHQLQSMLNGNFIGAVQCDLYKLYTSSLVGVAKRLSQHRRCDQLKL